MMKQKPTLSQIYPKVLDFCYTFLCFGLRLKRSLTRAIELGTRVLVIKDDQVLLVRHRTGKNPWSLPGGGVKAGETAADAAKREAREEAGCLIEIKQLHGVFHLFRAGFSNHVIVFLAKPLSEIAPPINDIEIAEACFVPLKQLPATLDFGSRRRIAEYLRGEANLTLEW